MLTVVQNNDESNDAGGGSLIDQIVRDGARQMLAAGLKAEVAAYIGSPTSSTKMGAGWWSATATTTSGR